MAPEVYWSVIAHGIAIGGHVRVGMEDCPYIEKGVYAKSNAELVERAVRIANEVGREIASPEEARQGLRHCPLKASSDSLPTAARASHHDH